MTNADSRATRVQVPAGATENAKGPGATAANAVAVEGVKEIPTTVKGNNSGTDPSYGNPSYGETERLGRLFRNHLQALGLPVPPTVPAAWRRAASALLDCHTTREIEAVIEWLGRNTFWRSKLTTFQTFAGAFPRMVLAARDDGAVPATNVVDLGGRTQARRLRQARLRAAMEVAGFTAEEIEEYAQ